MMKKMIFLTAKGHKKVGSALINTTDSNIKVQGPYVVVTDPATGKIHILDKDDIERIED
jgi:hypothetical protein